MTGRGKVVIRSKYEIEELKDGRSQIIFTEIPYQQTKENLLKKLAELVNGDRISGITDINDESDRKQPVRIVVKIKKGENAQVILNQLFQYSSLQDSFSIINLALVDGRPKLLPLRDMLRLFIEHRQVVIRRRTMFLLRQARTRAHVLEGLLIALTYIDEIIRIIRNSPDADIARDRLMQVQVSADILQRALNDPEARPTGPLTKQQAIEILRMQLQKLTGLEADKLAAEYKELRVNIERYELILSNESEILAIIREDLVKLKKDHANPRRSELSDEEIGDFDKEALIREEYMVVTITNGGYIKRTSPDVYRAQGRGGRGISAATTKDDDFLAHMFVALTHDYMLFFTTAGKVYWLKVYDIPEGSRTSGGRALVNLLQLSEGERVTGMVPVRHFLDDESLIMVTRRGTVKKTSLTAFRRPLGRGIIAVTLDEGDELIGVERITAGQQVILATKEGMSIRFDESDVRSMGRTAHGVRGIRLEEGDEVVGMIVADGPEDSRQLLTICSLGQGKRTPLTEYRSQSRGGKGLIDIKTGSRNGSVVAVAKVTDTDEIMVTTTGGIMIRTRVGEIRETSRNTLGVRIIRLDDGDSVGSLALVPEEAIEAAEARAVAEDADRKAHPERMGEDPAVDDDSLESISEDEVTEDSISDEEIIDDDL
jgi:DNA gyrase subunit A